MSTLTKEQRDKLPAEDFGDPGRRLFPIVDQDDVDSAAHLVGKAADPDAVKRRIIAIAKRKGLRLPDAWRGGKAEYRASFDGPARTDGEYVVRRGKLFEAGSYPDKDFALSPEEALAAVADFVPVPVDIEHTPSVLDGKLGTLERVELGEDGWTLFGDVRLPKWLDDLLASGERAVSCTWDRASKRLTGLALVRNPRISDAALMAAFAGKRHSASDQADMQQIHDIAARQGAECQQMQEGTAMPDAMTPEAQIGLFGKFMAWMGGQSSSQPAGVTSTTAAFSAPAPIPMDGYVQAPVHGAPAVPAAPDPEKEALRQQVAQLRAQQIADRAAAFAQEQIAASKALPAQRDALIAAYTVAASDDAEHGQATFGASKLGRVDALAALFVNAPTHTLRVQAVPVDAQALTNRQTTEGANFAATEADPKEITRLLAMTPEGKAVLKDLARGAK